MICFPLCEVLHNTFFFLAEKAFQDYLTTYSFSDSVEINFGI